MYIEYFGDRIFKGKNFLVTCNLEKPSFQLVKYISDIWYRVYLRQQSLENMLIIFLAISIVMRVSNMSIKGNRNPFVTHKTLVKQHIDFQVHNNGDTFQIVNKSTFR